jgi:hypothetical protein
MDKIYCKIEKQMYATEFLRLGFTATRNSIPGKFVETFHDEECSVTQCKVARRTFQDLYAIIKTYYPKYTKKNVANMLKTLHKSDNIFPIWCHAQDKIVFIKQKPRGENLLITHYIQNESWTATGNGNYSWKNINNLMI